MRREKKTVLTNGRATTMKDLREASWTDRERDKFLDRFNPYEVSDSMDGRFEIDVATENSPLILVDANDKKYSAYLDFTARGKFHGEDYIDIEKVKYSIYSLVIDDYSADLVEHDKWLDRMNEQGVTVVEAGDVQNEALLKELHSADGKSLDDVMEALTLVAVDHQWGEGNYDIEDDDYVVFYLYSSEGTKELEESTKKSAEPRLKERGPGWSKTHTYEIENDFDTPLKAYDGEHYLDLCYTIECTVDYTGDDDDTDGELRDYKVLGYEIDHSDLKDTIYIDGRDFDKEEVKEYLDKIVIIDGDREVPLKDYMEELAHDSVEDHAYEFDLDYDDYYDPADEYADANYDAWRDSQD